MRLKLLVDAISLLSPLTGIGKYTYEVSKILEKDEELELKYFYGYHSSKLVNPDSHKSMKSLKSLITRYPAIKRLTRELLTASRKLDYFKKYEIYWQPNFIPNRGIKAKKVVTTVHDFSFWLYRDFHPKEKVDYFDREFLKGVERSDFLITGSEFTKGEILERLSFPEDRVKVIYHGVDHQRFRIYEDNSLDFIVPEKFILSVGSIEPRKNLISLLKAYSSLDETIKDEYRLLLVGFRGWNNQEILELIEKNREYVEYLGFISTTDLAKLYNLATCFVYPSFYEGFGLPVLEAMASGSAVLSSEASSLREVGGDAVLYCNPDSIDDIREKLQTLLQNETLRESLKRKATERAKKFSWENSAKEHLELFKSL